MMKAFGILCVLLFIYGDYRSEACIISLKVLDGASVKQNSRRITHARDSLFSAERKTLSSYARLLRNRIHNRSTLSSSTTDLTCNADESQTISTSKKERISASGAIIDNLSFYEHMIAGAISRGVAQTAMHPANVVKTLLQTAGPDGRNELRNNLSIQLLTRGAGAQFILSLPHGAFSFAVVEGVRKMMDKHVRVKYAGFALDFISSAISTTIVSIISTPQMVLTDRIMAGIYKNLFDGVSTIAKEEGIRGFYRGWTPAIMQKIPSYGITWVFYQQLKILRTKLRDGAPATDAENFWMGAVAAAAAVCVMMPMDTVKTRIITQQALVAAGKMEPYRGVFDCFGRIFREEGVGAFYRALAPRLVSVVPMIGIQFGTYEFVKARLQRRKDRMYEEALEAAALAKDKDEKKRLEEEHKLQETTPDEISAEYEDVIEELMVEEPLALAPAGGAEWGKKATAAVLCRPKMSPAFVLNAPICASY